MAYATGTTVTAEKTLGEIKGLLKQRGVTNIMTHDIPQQFSLAFEYNGVPYRITLPLPAFDDPTFWDYKRGGVTYQRTPGAANELYDKEFNRRWRAFGMVIKAKIVAVEEGISTMEAEFIGNAILKYGRTVSETYASDMPALAASGAMSALALPGGGN